MKKAIDFMRCLLISFEFIILLVTATLLAVEHSPISILSPHISLTNDILKFFAVIPIGLLALSFKEIWPLLFPEFDKKRILQNWNCYYLLKNRIVVSVIYAVLFAIAGSSSWFITFGNSKEKIITLIVGSIVGSCTVYISVFFARIKINELFLQTTGKESASAHPPLRR